MYDFNQNVQPVNVLGAYAAADARKKRQQEVEMNAIALEQAKRANNNQNALAQAYAAGVRPGQTQSVNLGNLSLGGADLGSMGTSQVQGPVTVDRNAILNQLAIKAPGAVPEAQSMFADMDFKHQQQIAQLREAASKATKEQREAALKNLQIGSQIAQPLAQLEAQNAPAEVLANEYQRGIAQAQSLGLDISSLPPQYVPGIGAKIMQQGLEAKDAITAQETHRSNLASEQDKALQRDIQKRGQDITMRGQNMTDARARESNEINRGLKDVQLQKNQIELRQMNQVNDRAAGSLDNAISTIDRIYKVTKDSSGKVVKEEQHPGLSAVVGMKNPFGGDLGYAKIPGTRAANFQAELDTLNSQVFLQNIQAMRGMGALSNMEGMKVEAAIGALKESQDETQFKDNVLRVRETLAKFRDAVKQDSAQQPQPQSGSIWREVK